MDDATDDRRLGRRAALAGLAGLFATGAGCGRAYDGGRVRPAGDGTDAAAGVGGPGPTRTRTRTGSGTGTEPDADAVPVAGEAYVDVYRETIPSVVLVRTYGRAAGQGSGFVTDGGHVLTNDHVVADAGPIRVGFRGGGWRAATVAGTDPYSDLAALRVPERPSSASPLSFVRSDPPVGTPVVALGAPFALAGTASAGVISGQDRSLDAGSGFAVPDAVQTDAAVNPGNSGGPLVTLDGRVTGVISAGGGENVGLAVSAALARRVVPALVRTGGYRHPFLGVRLTDVTPAVAAANGVEPGGVLVVDVLRDGPSAGLLRGSGREGTGLGRRVPVGGDVIRALDGTATPSRADLVTHLALSTSPGETVTVRLARDGDVFERTVTLGARPPP